MAMNGWDGAHEREIRILEMIRDLNWWVANNRHDTVIDTNLSKHLIEVKSVCSFLHGVMVERHKPFTK